MRRAGVKSWERLFHNLRASRQTELCNDFPSHVVADWMGNTPDVADRHYLQLTAEHIRRAIASGAGAREAAEGGANGGARDGEKSGAKGGAACAGTPSHEPAKALTGQEVPAKSSDTVQPFKAHPTGLEPVTFGSVDRCSIQLS